MDKPIYLDYNGTTPIDPAVAAAMRPFWESEFGNPSSSHAYGAAPRAAVERARQQVAGLLQCRPTEVVFTSGGTESNNHAILGVVRARGPQGAHVITTAVEHPAVLEVCRFLESEGVETTYLPVDADGRVRVAAVSAAIRPQTVLISVMHANNEVGTIQPIAEIAALARARGIPLHSDAAQSIGKLPTTVDALGVDLLSVAGHKLYASKGIGALYVRQGLELTRFCHGAGQERGLRAGTENVMHIVGLGQACALVARDLAGAADRMRALRDRLHDGLLRTAGPVRLNGHPQERLPNTLNLAFEGLAADRLLERVGASVAASAGAACHAGTAVLSHVLTAMGVPYEWARGSVRFSLGRMTTAAEIDRAVSAVAAGVAELRRSA